MNTHTHARTHAQTHHPHTMHAGLLHNVQETLAASRMAQRPIFGRSRDVEDDIRLKQTVSLLLGGS